MIKFFKWDNELEQLAKYQEFLAKKAYIQFKYKESKMTREEAKNQVNTIRTGITDNEIDKIFEVIEALGLIKFEEYKKVQILCYSVESDHNFRIERWIEGFVIWHDGRIVYKSWVE